MRTPTIPALIAGATIVFQVNPAAATTLRWHDPATRDLRVTWSSASAEDLASTLAGQSVQISRDGANPELTGPGGGVALRRFKSFTIELDGSTGLVQAVRVAADGAIVRRTLFDAFAAGPSVFKRNGTTQVMVTVSKAEAATAAGLLDASVGTRRHTLQFDITLYDASGEVVEILDEVSLAFDLATLQPAVAWQKVRDYSGSYWAANDYSWYSPYSAE